MAFTNHSLQGLQSDGVLVVVDSQPQGASRWQAAGSQGSAKVDHQAG
jgi:hypothetical protein